MCVLQHRRRADQVTDHIIVELSGVARRGPSFDIHSLPPGPIAKCQCGCALAMDMDLGFALSRVVTLVDTSTFLSYFIFNMEHPRPC